MRKGIQKGLGAAAALLAAGFSWAAPAKADTGFFTPQEQQKIYDLSPVPPLPKDRTNAYADNEKAAGLGQILFFDKRLSCAGQVSCATCHDPAHGWSDGRALPQVFMDPALKGAKGSPRRHVPSLWNVAYNHWQFWDGRADSLWAQSLGPPENAIEMEGGSRLQYAHLVYGDPLLRKNYEAVFGKMPGLSDDKRFPLRGCPNMDDPKNPNNQAWQSMSPADQKAVNQVYANLGKSLEAFERKIVSRHSRFDDYVEGLREGQVAKLSALTEPEKRGLKLFVGKARCVACHNGPNFTDGAFHDIRVPSQGHSLAEDLGRYEGIDKVKANAFNGAGDFSDDHSDETKERLANLKAKPITKGQFKTPGLRNVAQFAPYMHQGQFKTLKDVVTYYSTLDQAQALKGPDEHLLEAVHLSGPEIDDLVAFLGALTDESADSSLVPPQEMTKK